MSTVGITFFGEIIPQAYFVRHALKTSKFIVPIIRFYRMLLYPVAKPTGILLDKWLGKEKISYFQEDEIEELLQALERVSTRRFNHSEARSGGSKIIAVAGATGGVGVIAVKLLSKLGYSVVAVTGKAEKYPWLKQLGAARVIGRDEVHDTSGKPLLSTRWAGAVDTVGGNTLTTLLRSTKVGGCVTACGLVAGTDLPLTVYPFILRGVTLAGIDSAWRPRKQRIEVWEQLADEWKLAGLDEISTKIGLSHVDDYVQKMLSGRLTGRVVIDPGA
ncbi:MAG: DUF21 domain-containing protein [Planctomycetes bacterium]|nr:DUF21 domain-containing protein [Planctomycetota bacterium]